MKSVMNASLYQAPEVDISRSSFKRDHGLKTAFNVDDIIPIFWDVVYPGDTMNLRMYGFARLSTPLHPLMDNMYLETFFFFIPYRILWPNFKKFMGEQDNPADSTDYTIPIIASDAAGYNNETIYDYFGLPTKVARSYNHSAMPLRAYVKCIDDWFRDENLVDSVATTFDDGPDLHSDYSIQKRGKRGDYFTTCLPWPAKPDALYGSAGVTIPLGTTAVVEGIGIVDGAAAATTANVWETDAAAYTSMSQSSSVRIEMESNAVPSSSNTPQVYANLSTATAATVLQWRQAMLIQELLEIDARGGTRYNELVYAHFGVTSPDGRVQRSEYLGGGSTPIVINAIPQSSETGTDQLGTMGAFGTASVDGHGFTKSITEHGIILGLCNIRADLTYQQGMERMWSDSTRYDLYWPALAHIGEQVVYTKELYMTTASAANDDDAFGYQERYGHLKFKHSRITGKFRSNDAASLEAYHLSQEFGSVPTLNNTFITSSTPIARAVAVSSEPNIIMDAFFDYQCARPMPVHSVPGLKKHF